MDRNTRKLELCALFRDWYEDNIGNKPSTQMTVICALWSQHVIQQTTTETTNER